MSYKKAYTVIRNFTYKSMSNHIVENRVGWDLGLGGR